MFDVFIIDMGGHDENVDRLTKKLPHAKVVRYYDNHLATIKRCVAKSRTSHVWILSSCCDYTEFDFDYKSTPWESYQIHCWASGNQKFGDTFLINVDEFWQQASIELLEWYKDIHWHEDGVPRLPWPTVTYTSDDLPAIVKATKFDTPYIQFVREGDTSTDFDPPLWKDRAVYTFNRANSVSLIPRDISGNLTTQIYDYPYVIKQKDRFLGDKLLDIIYISNGEPEAERWYKHLCDCTQRPIQRVQNVDGRRQAYQRAAELSTTDWFFTVFAKIEVNPEFDWSWQPDYLQEPKHYIFHSRNPVNGLEYGHMGVIAYNKRLVLDTMEPGLDFTLSRAHDVVPLLSATAHFNTTPELTWRTAFREVLKLTYDNSLINNIETSYRLKIWLESAEGPNAEWCLRGAHDAVEYYEKVRGDHDKLMLSFEWKWLNEYFRAHYTEQ